MIQHTPNITNRTEQAIRQELDNALQDEASEVISFKERSTIKDTTGQILKVDTSEGIDLAGITSDVEELRILQGSSEEIGEEEWDGVLVADGALVPVLWDALVAFRPLEVAAGAGDGEE